MMAHKKIYHHRPTYSSKAIIILLLMLLQFNTITMLTTVVVNSSSLSSSSSSSSSLESEDAKSDSLSISSSDDGERTSSSEGEFLLSKEAAAAVEAPLLTFSLRRPGHNIGSLEQLNSDNNAGIIHKAKIETEPEAKAAVEESNEGRDELLHIYSNEDNEGDNNDSNVSSESSDTDDGEGPGGRFRREELRENGAGGGGGGGPSSPKGEVSKAISTNWGTYEEQSPVVVHSGSHESDAPGGDGGIAVGRMATDADAAAVAANTNNDDSYAYGDEYQSNENENENDDSSEYDGVSSISYDDYEGERFGGRQFYPSQGVSDVEEHEPSGYNRQQYYATARPLDQQQGRQPQQQTEYRRPQYRNRFGGQQQQRPNKYRQPQEEETESTGSSLMGFFQKAKTFYDIFQAMNSAWKTVEDHYRKTGKGVFPEDIKNLNQSTPNTVNQLVNNNTRKMNTKRFRTTKVPITSTTTEEEEVDQQQKQEQEEQQDTWQEKDEYRSRRSWLKETVNDNKESKYHITAPPQSSSLLEEEEDDSQITEPDLPNRDSSAYSPSTSSSSSSSSTAIAEGRYIKGDPLKGYYDFVITEGSYKFWAVFQVGTALLIIYSTFAAIYYSKVNPLVSDYDYVDYLGGGRSLSDDSDFVDMDAPSMTAMGAGGSETTSPEGVSRSRQQEQSTSAGWIGWLPHAGHTLRFILESIDKVYNEE